MSRISNLSEARRLFGVVALVFSILSLMDLDYPWAQISEGSKLHYWYLVENVNVTSSSSVYSSAYTMDVYMGLLHAQSCQKFKSGLLPQSAGGGDLTGVQLCSELTYNQLHSFDLTHDWDEYANQCQDAGSISFALMIISIVIFALTQIISTYKNCQRRCCPDKFLKQQSNSKLVLPVFAILAPVFNIVAVIVYYFDCVEKSVNDIKLSQGQLERRASGNVGFWFACVSAFCLVLWWIAFAVWFCHKTLPTSVSFGKSSKHTHVADDSTTDDEDLGAPNHKKQKQKQKTKAKQDVVEIGDVEVGVEQANAKPSAPPASVCAGGYGDNSWVEDV